jgi:cytochrome c-type biogenesis protein CcmE
VRRRDQRLAIIGVAGAVLVLAATLTFAGLRDSVVYFVAPSELATKAREGHRLRLGGLVVEGSRRTDAGGVTTFAVTDGATQVQVRFAGILPDLFREGQGVVTEGRLGANGVFVATEVLAKHDEKYMPPEVAAALKKSGHWQYGEKGTQK